MRSKILLYFVFFGTIAFSLYGKDILTQKDVHRTVEEMLSYHVEHKAFSPLLVKRSFKLFLEQFDPYKIYLLQQEIAPFWNMGENQVQETILSHYKGKYTGYEQLEQLIRASVLRAREERKNIYKSFLCKNLISNQKENEWGFFPKSVQEKHSLID